MSAPHRFRGAYAKINRAELVGELDKRIAYDAVRNVSSKPTGATINRC